MKKSILFLALLSFVFGFSQILTPYQPTHTQPKVQFDYWVYSTNAGNGSTSQYPLIPTSVSDMNKMFDTSNSNTTLYQSGRTNSAKILDWQNGSDLSSLGINFPNAGTYFSFKIQGTFIPQETGTYTFSFETDDSCDLTINGSTIISVFASQAVPSLGTHTGTISLVAGKPYTFIARMQQSSGGYGLRLFWKSPIQAGSIASGYTTNWAQNINEIISEPIMDGSTSAKAAPSAQYIKNLTGTNTDGVYWINLPTVGPTQIYCIMNSAVDGGGWMMMMKATTGSTFQYSSPYWTSVSTLNPTDNTRNNGDAKYNTMNYYAGKDLLALWPDITTAGGSLTLTGYGCWSWLQNNFNNGVRITPINFFSSVNRLFFYDANNFAGKGTQFSSQTDVRFYGFNYDNSALTSTYTSQTRWGFGWNENGGGLFPYGNETSPDVSGGIGVSSSTRLGNYSAGDVAACCQNSTGINRSARVEIYIR